MFKLKDLSYDYSALEPYIDEATMRIHRDKHHQAYCDKFNVAIANYPEFQKKEPEEILKDLSRIPFEIQASVKNFGGGFVNHNFFWEILGKNKEIVPKGDLCKAIGEKFGSFEKFKEEFGTSALALFGSGWVWLVLDGENLKITETKNQESPLSLGQKPILAIDLWEHAYYLKYQNRRADYIQAFWNVINWEKAEELFTEAKK